MNITKTAIAVLVAVPLVLAVAIKAPFAAKPSASTSSQATADTADNKDRAASVAIFAGGCFWCVESDFDHVPGVLSTISGYTGGLTDNPTYKTHSKDKHREAVEITFDPTVTSYEKLLDVFWRSVNPTDAGGQFCDRGHSYSTAIYTLDQNQFDLATASKQTLNDNKVLDLPVVTEITEAAPFYPAEEYHQDYYQKNPIRYKLYRKGCGRDKIVEKVWGDQAHAGITPH